MRLFIAEKPSLARAIAEVLPAPRRRTRDSIACGPDDVVVWCFGHILAPVLPEDYDPKYKVWRLEDLPILPSEWKLQVSAPAPIAAIKKLLPDATRVVHAGDPDREGQLLVDEVLRFLGYKGPVDRILISDPTPAAVRRQLEAIEPNSKYRPLSDAALARQRADWVYGMTMTRLYTLLGQRGGYRGVLSVGRVQTPLLGLIARRDLAIAGFRPATYFTLSAELKTAAGETFRARWSPGPAAEPHLDEDKRLVQKDIAEDVRRRVEHAAGTVTASERETKSEAPPLPYSLADLQIDAAKRLGLSAKEVLDACQRLYETHRLVTYPRSDCAYLPEGHWAESQSVLGALVKHAPALAPFVSRADRALRSKAWNDAKVIAHHAIIPTANVTGRVELSPTDRSVYELIARRYLSQFYPAFEYHQTRLEMEIAGEKFTATGRQARTVGWKELSSNASTETEERDPESEDAPLPHLEDGAAVTATEVVCAEKQTKPPKPFTDASLMQAMVNIAGFVSTLEAKKVLTETDGIGTPATRPAIIETLFHRNYVERRGKTIVSTALGRQLVASLPEVATTPDMTAVWETTMRAITEGTQSLEAFLERVGAQIQQCVADGKAGGKIDVPSSDGARASRATARNSRTRPSGSAPKRRPAPR